MLDRILAAVNISDVFKLKEPLVQGTVIAAVTFLLRQPITWQQSDQNAS